MKKIIALCICFALWAPASHAAAIKLGNMSNEAHTVSKEMGPTSGKEKLECTRDSDCASTQRCNMNSNKCVDTCSMVSCIGGRYCLAEGNHSYSCKGCLTNSHCSADKKCSNYSCVDVCSGVTCNSGKQCKASGTNSYTCVDCVTDSNCAAGNKCSGNSCVACTEGDACRCPTGEVADGTGGCKASIPATCSVWDDKDPTSLYWNANGSRSIPKGIRCWNGYGANATITVPGTDTYEHVTIRFWQGATVNGALKTKDLHFVHNTSPNPHTITFNSPVTVNGTIYIQRGVATPVFKAGISGSYTCKFVDCPKNQYGPSANETSGPCPWLSSAASDNKDADCVKYCGSGFFYDRPGAKYSGAERVCTKYPKSCGYNCTYGWDIWYPNNPYTCQQAKQN